MKPTPALTALVVMFLSTLASPALANPTLSEGGGTVEPTYEPPVLEGPVSSNRDVRIHLAAALPDVTKATLSSKEAMLQASDAVESYRYELALAHFRRAAELGDVEAQRIAGMMMLFGETLYGPQVKRNPVEGVRLLQQAARQGCVTSKFVLARLNPQGRPELVESAKK